MGNQRVKSYLLTRSRSSRPLCPMSRFLLRTKSRSQRMGRIAYLSKRGNIWWFRRRHPAIAISLPQNAQVSGACGSLTRTAQAKGHLAEYACIRAVPIGQILSHILLQGLGL